jgi:Arc/MetJ-type ribon-helix-helix transcriptional regulator
MVRTQIQLTEKQAVALKRLAAKKRVSMAELIRVGVNKLLHSVETVSLEERRQRAIAIAGRFRSGRSDLSTKHDEHLAEIY